MRNLVALATAHLLLSLLATAGICSGQKEGQDFFPLPEGLLATDEVPEGCEEDTCRNGGSCRPNGGGYHDEGSPCECLEGFGGKFCEVGEDPASRCEKECFNGGACKLGVDDDSTEAEPIEHCECPDAFYGDQCEREADLCGEKYCRNGSKCLGEIKLANGSTEHLCDCSRAYTESMHFAGQFCQYPSTEFCTGSEDPNGRQFCTNGGSCPSERNKPCNCPPGFLGPRCAYQIEVDGGDHHGCDLDCQNGGTCQKQGTGLACRCPHGFEGSQCEYEIERSEKASGSSMKMSTATTIVCAVAIGTVLLSAAWFLYGKHSAMEETGQPKNENGDDTTASDELATVQIL